MTQKAKRFGRIIFSASFDEVPMNTKETKDGDIIPHELQLETVSIICHDKEFSAQVIELPRWAYNDLVEFITESLAEKIDKPYSSLPF